MENSDTNDAMQDPFRLHIAVIKPDNFVVDRYSTDIRYAPEDPQALGIPAFWGRVNR